MRSDYWRTFGVGDETNDGGNEYLFGDFKYGLDALDKDLWGDDDLIYGGYGDGAANQRMYGGDGADYISAGHNWAESYTEGGNGNDKYKAPQTIKTSATFKGGDGDDVVLVAAYGDVASGEENLLDKFMGQAGNDVIRGTHKAGAQYLYGGDGEDKLYGGDGQTDAEKYQVMTGGAGDDWLHGGDGFTGEQWIYGDTYRKGEFNMEYDVENQEWEDNGDDVIYGGSNGAEDQLLIGGYGNDKIFSGSNNTGRIRIFGDLRRNLNNPEVVSNLRRGSPQDGDDLIDILDNPDADGPNTDIQAFGQGGNDKIFGSIGNDEELYGGDGDDKIWAENPGQVETEADVNTIFGGNGKDIIYGSVMRDRLYGDWQREYDDETILNDDSENPGKFDTEGDDDIIYTGVSTGTYETGGDYVHGGWGNDKIYGQGTSGHWLNGEFGDDMIWGSEGNDYIYGDDYN